MSAVTPGTASTGVERDLRERAESASYALMAYWWYRWDWGEGAGLDGILDAAATTGWEAGLRYVLDELRRELRAHEQGQPASPHAPGRCMLRLADDLGARAVDAYAREAAAGIADAFHARRPGARQLFVDSLYSDPPLLVELGLRSGDAALVETAAALALEHLEALQDARSNLLAHFADEQRELRPRVDWGRGNGWGLAGLADLLAVLPREVERRAELVERFTLLARALTDAQDDAGFWRNLVSSPTSYPESSATALIVVALTIGVEHDLLDDDAARAARRGWAAIEHRIDANGHLAGVSFRPGLHADPVRYEHVPQLGVYPWGNGPYLRAAAQRLERAGCAPDHPP